MRPDLLQSALIAYLKTQSTVVLLLDSSQEIKENQWQGRDFLYPAIRLDNMSLYPDNYGNCNNFKIDIRWLTFSEKPSSWEVDKISGIISQVLHNKQFVSEGLSIYLVTKEIKPADRKDERLWQGEVRMSGTASIL